MLKNRVDAGKKLGDLLKNLPDMENTIVLSIPRGGVIVGNEISKKLKCKHDIVISKKITPPEHPEFAVGAINFDGTIFRGPFWEKFEKGKKFEEEIKKKQNQVLERLKHYRGKVDYNIEGKTVILVDDGIATGSSVLVLVNWILRQKVKHVILAIPVIPADTYEKLKPYFSKIISLEIPTEFSAVGQFYEHFNQVKDKEILEILKN